MLEQIVVNNDEKRKDDGRVSKHNDDQYKYDLYFIDNGSNEYFG
jgi:hypothetical protein